MKKPKYRVARYVYAIPARLDLYEQTVIAPAEKAGETKCIVLVSELRWLWSLAKKSARRQKPGRPPRVALSPALRQSMIARAKAEIRALRAEAKATKNWRGVNARITAIVEEAAAELSWSITHAWDVLAGRTRRDKKKESPTAPSG